MKLYIGFDDTDTLDSPFGTGKLVRRFQSALPEGMSCLGVVRQQLFVCDQIPYTSHNSAACMIVEAATADLLNETIELAARHIRQHAAPGSDPGLCVTTEMDPALAALIEFGYFCTRFVATQQEAIEATRNAHLSGHGGTNDGIIGAAAAVGLTASGWCGRFIEYGMLRGFPAEIRVSDLNQAGITVIDMERDAIVPAPDDIVVTHNWLRPRLWGHQPVLPVSMQGEGRWCNVYSKRKKS